MCDHLSDNHLRTAASNLERLRSYFEARTTWQVSPESADALSALHASLTRTTQTCLQPLLEEHGVDPPGVSTVRSDEALPPGHLDGPRLERFTAFVEQLGEWFAAQRGKATSELGRNLLATVHRSLAATTAAVAEIQHTLAPEGQPEPSASAPVGPSATASAMSPLPAPEVERIDARLVLEDSEETPLLQTFRGNIELTWEAKKEIERFLHEAQVNYQGADLIRFQRKVLQWIEATPPGHVLVIKVSCLTGYRQAYPAYAMKSGELSRAARHSGSGSFTSL